MVNPSHPRGAPALSTQITSPEEQLSWLRITLVPGVSPGVQRALLERYSQPSLVLAAHRSELASLVGPEVAERLAVGPEPVLLERALTWLSQPARFLLVRGGTGYPNALLTMSDPPVVLYAMGRVELLNQKAIAVVGSRNATPQGIRDAHAFSTALSNAGYCIVSGLALGIDAAAHRGGLEGEGSSIAVVGTGADIVYPRRNLDLAHRIAEFGCVVSEFPLGTRPLAGNFPRRNRLISGLSRGALVVEAARDSGSLITARFALEQGRDIFAIPGSIHSPFSKGCHDLIKEGAKLVECAADVLDEIACTWGESRMPAPPLQPSPLPPHPLLDLMGFAPISVDQIAQRTGLAAGFLASQLSRFEIEGHVSLLPGGWFQRVDRIE